MSIFTITALVSDILSDGSTRTFGYFLELKEAKEAVLENRCDIHELYYGYVVIEEFEEGIHQAPKNEYWYNWRHDKGYVKCKKPDKLQDTFCFGMG